MPAKRYQTVDEYIAAQAKNVQPLLQDLRKVIRESAPGAEELISYNMPYYKLGGRLVYFCAFSKHIGFYALTSAIKAFQKELKGYKTSTGTVQLPIDKPIPKMLVKRIIKYRVKENLAKAALKKKKIK